MAIQQDVQSFTPGELVSLFSIDTSTITVTQSSYANSIVSGLGSVSTPATDTMIISLYSLLLNRVPDAQEIAYYEGMPLGAVVSYILVSPEYVSTHPTNSNGFNSGGTIYNFTPSTPNNEVLVFGGISYLPLPIDTNGFEVSTNGASPRPTIRLANVLGTASAILVNGDLLGAQITRLQTLSKYLDGQPDADSSMYFPIDVYRVEQKTAHNKVYIEWQLAAATDQENKMIPARQVLRDVCMKKYRVWQGTDPTDTTTDNFNYAKATCPYTGSEFFDINDASTTLANQDSCPRHLASCKLRFPGQQLPFGGFPGVGRTLT